MAFLAVPRRKRIAQTEQRLRHFRDEWARPSLADLPSIPSLPTSLPDLSDLVDAAIEAGTRLSPVRVSLHRPRRRRRAAGLVVLFGVVAGVALAYRWWQRRDRDGARLIDEPAGPVDAPSAAPPAWEPPATPLEDAPTRPLAPAQPSSSWTRNALVVEAAEACEVAEPATRRPWVAPARPEQTQPREFVRPTRAFDRGPSTEAPRVPATRASIPERPAVHLPR